MKVKINLFLLLFLSFIIEFFLTQKNIVLLPLFFMNVIIVFYFLNVEHFKKYIRFDFLRLVFNDYVYIILFVLLLENTFSFSSYYLVTFFIIYIIFVSILDIMKISLNPIYISFLIISFLIYELVVLFSPLLTVEGYYISLNLNTISLIIFNILINIIINILILKLFSKQLTIKD